MSQDHLVKLTCKICKTDNYFTTRNRKSVEKKLEMKKFCKKCRKNTLHKETKV